MANAKRKDALRTLLKLLNRAALSSSEDGKVALKRAAPRMAKAVAEQEVTK